MLTDHCLLPPKSSHPLQMSPPPTSSLSTQTTSSSAFSGPTPPCRTMTQQMVDDAAPNMFAAFSGTSPEYPTRPAHRTRPSALRFAALTSDHTHRSAPCLLISVHYRRSGSAGPSLTPCAPCATSLARSLFQTWASSAWIRRQRRDTTTRIGR
jgi:hypothetical protein